MENEKHFYPTPESHEQPTREYSVNFLSFIHPDAEKAEKTYDTQELVAMMNKWWKQICEENNIDPNDKKFNNVDYYIFELGKNALEHAGGGKIKVIFESEKITVTISDQGEGFVDRFHIDYELSAGRGLEQAYNFADEFSIETNGKKYVKLGSNDTLTESEETDIKHGTKITFIKNFE